MRKTNAKSIDEVDIIIKDLAKNLRPHFSLTCSIQNKEIIVFDCPKKYKDIAYVGFKGQTIHMRDSFSSMNDDKIDIANPNYINQVIEMIKKYMANPDGVYQIHLRIQKHFQNR